MNIDISKFILLFQKGVSQKQIAFELNISKTSVGRIKFKLKLSRPNIEIKVPNNEIIQNQDNITILAKKYKVRKSSLYERLRNLGIILDKKQAHRKRADIIRKHIIDYSHFATLDRIGCYYLGLIYADGSIFKDGNEYALSISLKRGDISLLYQFVSDLHISSNNIHNRIGTNHLLHGRIIPGRPYSYIRIHNYHLLDILRSYGLNPGLQYKRHLPDLPFMADFIRGFLDGDGTICTAKIKKYKYLSIQFAITYKSFALELNAFLQKVLNVRCSFSPGGSIFYLKTTGSKAEIIAKWLWDDPIRTLARKRQRYINWLKCPRARFTR